MPVNFLLLLKFYLVAANSHTQHMHTNYTKNTYIMFTIRRCLLVGACFWLHVNRLNKDFLYVVYLKIPIDIALLSFLSLICCCAIAPFSFAKLHKSQSEEKKLNQNRILYTILEKTLQKYIRVWKKNLVIFFCFNIELVCALCCHPCKYFVHIFNITYLCYLLLWIYLEPDDGLNSK